MNALMQDRDALRDRLLGVVEVVAVRPAVERDAMAAIGFCFGGLCVLDLANGTGLKAVVHGVLRQRSRARHPVRRRHGASRVNCLVDLLAEAFDR